MGIICTKNVCMCTSRLMTICQRLLNSRETDVTQIRSNTWIERIHLRSTLSLFIVALLHINQRMLTCSTVRPKDSWQNDWSQGFWLCDQEDLPCCDTCVKVPYQSHIWYSECGSTSDVPATHYCWVQMCLGMSHVFILQRYLRLLAPCCNPTTKCHTGTSTTFKYSNPPGCQLHLWWRCSDPQNSMKNWADLWVTLWKVYWVCKKQKYDQPTFCLMATQVILPQRQFSSEMEEIIRQ